MLAKHSWGLGTLLLAGGVLLSVGGCETQFTMAPTDMGAAGTGPAPLPPPSSMASPGTGVAAGTGGDATPTTSGPVDPTAGTPSTPSTQGAGGTPTGPDGTSVSSATNGSTGTPAGTMVGTPSSPGPDGMPAPGGTTPGQPDTSGTPSMAGPGTTPGTPADPATPVDPVPAEPPVQTCPATSALQPGETTQRIQVGGSNRSFILYVPGSYTGQQPVPLILDWHGILMNSGLQRSFSGYAELSEREGFIVAFPEGTDTAFNVGICCTSSTAVDDVAFARAIVATLQEQGCIDNRRIHSVGYSMGGGMSMHLACNAADLVASIAISAFDMMPEQDWPCQPSRAVPFLAFRSTGDPIVPYAGAVNTIPPNGTSRLVTFIGAKENLAKWAGLDGCTGTPQQMGSGCEMYTECNDGAEVGLCTKQGGGHDYMDPAQGWAFLKRHPMP